MLRIWSASGDQLAALSGEKFCVEDLKRHLRAEHGFPVCLQRMVCDGACLKDEDEVTAPAWLQLVLSIDTSNEQQKREAGKELVFYAAEKGCVETAQRLLQVCTDRGYYSKALTVAARKGHTEIVRLLVDAGADKESRDANRWTALLHAAAGGHTEIAGLLLDAGADKDVCNGFGKSALLLATENGRTEISRMLVDGGADTDLQDKKTGKTALMYAASAGHTDIARLVLDAGADKDVRQRDGKSALLLAVVNRHIEITRMLVHAGADKDLQDLQAGKTALMYAASAGQAGHICHYPSSAGCWC